MTTNHDTPPSWLRLDDIITTADRDTLALTLHDVLQAIADTVDVFQAARVTMCLIERRMPAGLPVDVFDQVYDSTELGKLWSVLHAFAEVVSPETGLPGAIDRNERLNELLEQMGVDTD